MHQPAATLHPAHPASIRVLFFGPLRTLLQTETCELPYPASSTVADFWAQLLFAFPQLETARTTTRLARDHEFLAEDDQLHPGDEIALIPPVSGG